MYICKIMSSSLPILVPEITPHPAKINCYLNPKALPLDVEKGLQVSLNSVIWVFTFCLSKESCSFHQCSLYVKLGSSKYEMESISNCYTLGDLLLKENKLDLILGKNNYSQPGILQEFCRASVNEDMKPKRPLNSSFPLPCPQSWNFLLLLLPSSFQS